MPHCQNSSKIELLDHRNRGKIDTLLHAIWYPITYKLIPYYIQINTLLHTNWYPITCKLMPITNKLTPYYIQIDPWQNYCITIENNNPSSEREIIQSSTFTLAAVLFILLFDINLPSVESTFSQADDPPNTSYF
jgi:hypothetical protein